MIEKVGILFWLFAFIALGVGVIGADDDVLIGAPLWAFIGYLLAGTPWK
jgi:hypothetical protein